MKTSELTSPALDWAVAKAAGYSLNTLDLLYDIKCYSKFKPSTNWSQGGPIIERERVDLCVYTNEGVDTNFRSKADELGNYSHEEEYVVSVPEVLTWTAWKAHGSYKQDGPTPLIAAMRCYVASKLGDKVEVPNELV